MLKTTPTYYVVSEVYRAKDESAMDQRLRRKAQRAELKEAGLARRYKTKAAAVMAVGKAVKAGKLSFTPEIGEAFGLYL
jgi:hypothetical protein